MTTALRFLLLVLWPVSAAVWAADLSTEARPAIFAPLPVPSPTPVAIPPPDFSPSSTAISDHLRTLLTERLHAVADATRAQGTSTAPGVDSKDVSIMKPFIVNSSVVKEVRLPPPEKFTEHFLRTGNLFHLGRVPVNMQPKPYPHLGVTRGVPSPVEIVISPNISQKGIAHFVTIW